MALQKAPKKTPTTMEFAHTLALLRSNWLAATIALDVSAPNNVLHLGFASTVGAAIEAATATTIRSASQT
jgi:hypothetical protein